MNIKSVVSTPTRGVLLDFDPVTLKTAWSRDVDQKDKEFAPCFTRDKASKVARTISAIVYTRPNLSGLDLVPKALLEDIW